MVQDTSANVVTFGVSHGADVQYQVVAESGVGIELTLDGRELRPRLAGRFNGANIAAAYAVARSLGIAGDTAARALEEAPAVAGRFEVVSTDGERTVIVDYAHTPDALESLLSASRRLVNKGAHLWCVFGCGGDRDRGKRPIMGAIAEKYADRVVVTSDNPRTESAEKILDEIRMGMRESRAAHFEVDRRAAIHYAADTSTAGDVVVIAGKGHETVQVVGTERNHFDDRVEARRAFNSGPPSPKDG
jgi:UDP-N-acetylmuramoyl-L-alanyl-D-glutamate--2,6-diaminopimelate ligase